MEVPAQRLDDISCAIDFLVRHPRSMPSGSARSASAPAAAMRCAHAATELRVKAVAAVSTFNLGEARREGMARSPRRAHETPEGRRRGAVARSARRAGAAGAGGAGQRRGFHGEHAAALPEGYDYYARLARSIRTRRTAMSSRACRSRWPSSLRAARHDLAPAALVIAGSRADTLFWSRQAYERARGAEGAARRRRRDAHRHVRSSAVRGRPSGSWPSSSVDTWRKWLLPKQTSKEKPA